MYEGTRVQEFKAGDGRRIRGTDGGRRRNRGKRIKETRTVGRGVAIRQFQSMSGQ